MKKGVLTSLMILAPALLIFVAVVIGAIFDIWWPTGVSFGLFFLSIFICLVLVLTTQSKYRKSLLQECDPQKHMKILQFLIKLVPVHETAYKLDLAVIQRNMGNFDAALEILQSVNLNLPNTLPNYAALYFNNLSDLFTLKENYVAAQDCIDRGFGILPQIVNEQNRAYLYSTLSANLATKNMFCGYLEGCEAFFEEKLKNAKNTYEKIEESMSLADYYRLAGVPGKAAPHLDFIIANGNKLFHVERAREYKKECL